MNRSLAKTSSQVKSAEQPAAAPQHPLPGILRLQQTIGNQAVLQLLRSSAISSPLPPAASNAVQGPRQQLEVAQHGTSESGSALPHLAAIQRSFGRHDVGEVFAHQGSRAAAAARAIGARAYALGNNVAFARSPDLHTAAHEAAHAVQQRAGVQVANDVGQPGDVYERHADAVADQVVRGGSAEALLDKMTPAGSRAFPPATVQRKEDWDFTPDDYKELVNKKMDLKFGPDSAWFPKALQDNLLTTLKFALASTKPARTAGINVKDFYHGHFAIPNDKTAGTTLRGRTSAFDTKSKELQGKALGRWSAPVTDANLPAFTKAMEETEKLATPLLEEALKIKGAAVFYHTYELSGPRMNPGSPIRNIMTPVGGSPGGFDPSGVEKSANQFRDSFFEILQFAFLVDETGVIHVTVGSVPNLSRVTGTPLSL